MADRPQKTAIPYWNRRKDFERNAALDKIWTKFDFILKMSLNIAAPERYGTNSFVEFLSVFFIRSLLGLGVVVALLPVAPEHQDKIENISAIEAVGAAASAMRDVSGFCGRNPQTCETGGKAAMAIGYKAKFGAQQLMDRVQEQRTEPEIQTGAISTKQIVAKPTAEQELPKKIVVQAAQQGTPVPTPRTRPDI